MRLPPTTLTVKRADDGWHVSDEDGHISWSGADIRELMMQAGRYVAFAADQFDKLAAEMAAEKGLSQ